MSYRDRLVRHLGEYKRSVLDLQGEEAFNYRGRAVMHRHILPVEHASLNLLDEAREHLLQFQKSTTAVIKYHRYFRHLNSSQAFAFNLFFPYFNGGRASSKALLRALGQQGELQSWEPEAVPEPSEGTNIDAIWRTTDGTTTYCEVKLSEISCGRTKGDERHLEKLKSIYEPQLRGHVALDLLEAPQFFNHYQTLRNVWHMVRTDGSRLIFLLPRANRVLWASIAGVLLRVDDVTRARISLVAIEDTIGALCSDHGCPANLREYAGKLRRKYLPEDL